MNEKELRDFAEFITKLDYPNAIDEVVKIRAESLVKAYKREKINEIKEQLDE